MCHSGHKGVRNTSRAAAAKEQMPAYSAAIEGKRDIPSPFNFVTRQRAKNGEAVSSGGKTVGWD